MPGTVLGAEGAKVGKRRALCLHEAYSLWGRQTFNKETTLYIVILFSVDSIF